MYARIIGTGSYLPKKKVTNTDLEGIVDTSDEWIKQRVGIESRYYADETETTLYMATESAKKAIKDANISVNDIGLILVATSTSDYIMPSTACMLQHELGAPTVAAFDISAACSGFVYTLDVAKQYIESGSVKNVLIVASERLSRVIDFKDRSTCVLFGDGAAAVVLGADEKLGIKSSILHSDGKDTDLLNLKNSLDQPMYEKGYAANTLKMVGNKVFKIAVTNLSNLVSELLHEANIDSNEIDWLVPHQANLRILEATAKKLNMPFDRVIVTLGHHGNTSAVSIPLALDEAIKDGRIKKGDTLLLEAFGA
ncbi:MAG: 3-oxoacyl-[acyl-carrier-protein] synthase-3, partial [Francisellaceae bacterium]